MSEKKIPILHLKPEKELFFKGPFDKVAASTIRLTNPSNDQMYFHVQAPSRDIWVLPNSGVLAQNETKEIIIHCKPFDIKTTDPSRDRLIIKSTPLCYLQTKPEDAVLASMEKVDSMLKCIFKAPELSASAVQGPNRGAT
ncbi:unnamed protein product [Dicrocoelium dendriticum]|nr:unnamed protein product [Dicrocoelium dendriticum]